MTAATASRGWSDARVDRLKALWMEGRSASQIARALGGTTRNAVIGKIHRLGLSGRAAPSRPGAVRPSRGAAPRLRRSPPQAHVGVCIPVRAPAPEGPGLYAGFAALPAHRCKWPIGDPLTVDFSFCGQPARKGPYCPAHAGMAYRPNTGQPALDGWDDGASARGRCCKAGGRARRR